MVKLKVDIGDLARLQASLLDDSALRELPGRLAETTERQTQERFGRRRAPSGKRWEPRKRQASHPLLERTGRLRRSIEAEGSEQGGTPGVELKAPVPYAQIIQSKRQFLGWSKRDQGELAADAEQFIARLTTGALR